MKKKHFSILIFLINFHNAKQIHKNFKIIFKKIFSIKQTKSYNLHCLIVLAFVVVAIGVYQEFYT
jgi:hypothetical protein